jgi:hypothetical protein
VRLGGPNSFTPWKPPPIPSGYYDPSLDAQRGSASRGLLYTEQDVGTQGRYAQQDWGWGQEDIGRDYTRGMEDMTTGRDRGLQDITRDRGYAKTDYDRGVEMLTRNYGQLGRQQGEQQRRYGVTSGGGIGLLAAAKRAENMGLERRDIDTGYQRQVEGFDTGERRIGEDFTRGTGRLTQDRDTAITRGTALYDRGVAGRGDTLSRARSEDTFYGLDVDAQKLYQSQQAGYEAPTGPANQRTTPGGRVVRDVVRGGYVYTYDQNGKLVNKKRKR